MNCFVIMPFAPDFDDVYASMKSAIEGSVPGETVKCFRLDEIKSAGRITDDLLRELHHATVCIADLTSTKPNVMWEVGYAMALKKPIIFITQSTKELPFDIKDMRTIEYNRNSLTKTLLTPLGDAFRQTLGTYEVLRQKTKFTSPTNAGRIIAVTGSMDGDDASCARRVAAALAPHIGEGVTWLIGSYGLCDEQAAQFLIAHGEKVVVVGYHSYDISDEMLLLVKQHHLPFVDAKQEQLPKGIRAPSARDLYFLGKADFVILLWNGNSEGTKEMLNWYSSQQKDHQIAYF